MSVLRDTAFGQLTRLATRNKIFRYPEERPGFKIPDTWQAVIDDKTPSFPAGAQSSSSSSSENEEETTDATPVGSSPEGQHISRVATANSKHPHHHPMELTRSKSRNETEPFSSERVKVEEEAELSRTKSTPIVPVKTSDGTILVDWYYSDDSENPQNWSRLRRGLVTAILCIYTFVVYTSSAIYTVSEQGVSEEFGITPLESTLGLALFVLGYGIGPLIFSPLSEIGAIGRNPVYVVTVFLFVILSIPTALVHNAAGLFILRFLQGFFGSPCLASGGASIGDMYSFTALPYGLVAWVSAAYMGPALGPLLAGYSVPAEGWRWSLLEIIWASAPAFIIMFLLLPETSASNILYRRAQRLRKLTGNPKFQSQSELDMRNLKPMAVAVDALIKPIEITIKDPAILFVQIYTAITYGIYYSFFEVFPIVYAGYHNFTYGQIGLVFLCVAVACLLGIVTYVTYIHWYLNPRIRTKGWPVPELRLVPAMIAAFGPTIGLFLFAWTASPNIHWIVPTIGITIYGATVFVVMQCIFVYVPISYPRYAASLFAGNDFFRSSLAFAAILFSQPLYDNLGVARGTTLLAGLSVIGIVGIWILYFYGAKLRSKSSFADYSETDDLKKSQTTGEKKGEA